MQVSKTTILFMLDDRKKKVDKIGYSKKREIKPSRVNGSAISSSFFLYPTFFFFKKK